MEFTEYENIPILTSNFDFFRFLIVVVVIYTWQSGRLMSNEVYRPVLLSCTAICSYLHVEFAYTIDCGVRN